MSENNRSYEGVKYLFNDDEIKVLGEALAREAQSIYDLRERKTVLSAELTSQIKNADKRAADLATKINLGFEFREVETLTLMETPRPGQKTIIRVDTQDTLRTEPMTMREMQQSFGFKETGEAHPD